MGREKEMASNGIALLRISSKKEVSPGGVKGGTIP